ncbi:hypothetical protein [Mucilaginibacter auburnensis]|uniref:Uncharacterized protein n=1 Tax=Mucilaginibacter auburnensis TaxID=1457233 RepID=A0A2H9VMJ1_9SPHI|nr:hypothetical protein [Mucilaginibacter auburnensis]PJJ79550.1 hypothetical protein CLV57_2684 [Mucilaginibacter auburnensis]
MKKLTAILILVAYLFSTTELHQLLKLPIVFQHYKEHKAWNSGISFLDFLDMHYMHGSPHYGDYDEDMQLPFKSFDKCLSTTIPVIVPQKIKIAVHQPVKLKKQMRFMLTDDFIPSLYLSRIWQPPKAC